MRKTLKFSAYTVLLGLIIGGLYLANLFLMRPVSLDHYLAKNLVVDMFDSPETITHLGLVDRFNWLTQHNSKLSLDGLEKIESDLQKAVDRRRLIASYPPDSLSHRQRITQKIALFDLDNEIRETSDFRFHGYLLEQLGGVHLDLVEFMTDIHPIRSRAEAEDYISRIDQFDEVFDSDIEILEAQHREGVHPPAFVYQHVLRQLHEFLAYGHNDNPLYTVFIEKVDNLELSVDVVADLEKRLKSAIDNGANRGFSRLRSYVDAHVEHANPHDGVWSLPNGEAFYELRLRTYTTTDATAESIHQLGLSEVDRITRRMREILNGLGYPTAESVGVLMNSLNEESRFLYRDTPNRKDIVVGDYSAIVAETKEAVGSAFRQLPRADVVVRAVPEYSEKTAAGGYYMSPALDGSRPGVFYANLYDIQQTPKYGMRTLAFHEAIPGHHFQNALNLENEDLSLYRKHGYGTSAFSEGWALYAERLALEMGLVENPFDELGVLQSELFRAVRLVVDTGIHYKRWTRREAIDYMKNTTGMSNTEVVVEIERYIVWPGQACSYKMGMLKILELRERAKTMLDAEFDLKTFHSTVLDHGEPPLFVLEELVEQMIEDHR
ncbi:MAG TPA: DUF885 domain-containing protein [Gammaproteobacteria bacterium]|nr:DUF885 domain-containing protein [Gammaproteobacteria bacterium]